MKKTLIMLLTVLLGYSGIARAEGENGLFTHSIDPKTDSIFLSQIRNHLDSVRTARKRPIVGLVLCGGGAKGAAEVGALKVIDSLQIPIDFVCGTSVGSLLGGMIACGYSVGFMEDFITRANWPKLLSDKVDPAVIPLSTKIHKSRYFLSIPFHYAKDNGEKRLLQKHTYSDNDGHISIDKVKGNLAPASGNRSLASSLPAGYVYGFNVNNLFSSLTVGYQDSISFAKMPIPFACVTTDVVSCTAKNFGSGRLKTAMRGSMGIPGLFTPIRSNGMVLVDGGSRDNFPTDIAKAVGCDYIIGIDISDMDVEYQDVNNVGTVLSQLITMLVRENLDKARSTADIYIRPDVTGYTSMSFNAEAVDSLLVRGHAAANQVLDQLIALKKATGSDTLTYNAPKAVNINNRKVMLRSISFDGMSDAESRVLHRLIKLDIRKGVDAEMLEKAAAIVQASGAVESVSYSLLGASEPYALVFNCSKAPVHRIAVGAHIDTEVWAELGFNIGLNVNKLLGPKLDIQGKVGQSQGFKLHFMYGMPGVPTINAEASINNHILYEKSLQLQNTLRLEASFWKHEEKIYISSTAWPAFSLKGGVKNSFYQMRNNRMTAMARGIPDELRTTNIIGAFASAHLYTLDNYHFPKKGMEFKAIGNVDFFKSGLKHMAPKYSGQFALRGAIPFGERVCLIPDLHLRFLFDQDKFAYKDDVHKGVLREEINQAFSFSHRNFIGGELAGRYFEHQIPFVGFNDVMDCVDYIENDEGVLQDIRIHDHLGVLNLDLRVNVWKELYISALGGYAHMTPSFREFFAYKNNKDIFAAGIQASYNTIAGPIKFRVQWCDHSINKRKWSAYFSVGYNF